MSDVALALVFLAVCVIAAWLIVSHADDPFNEHDEL